MNELITRCLEEGSVTELSEFPTELLTAEEVSLVEFITNYNFKYGAVPKIKRVLEFTDEFVPFVYLDEEDKDPLGDVRDRTIAEKLAEKSESLLRDARATIVNDGKLDLEILREIEMIHSLAMGVERITTFDRERYFRRKAIDLPFKLINQAIGGLCFGDYLLLAGRLGSGKSTVSQFVSYTAFKQGKKVLYISAEMLGADVFSRVDGMLAEFNPLDLRAGRNSNTEKKLKEARKAASSMEGEIFVPKRRVMKPSQIFSLARNLAVDLIIVDGAYLLTPDGSASKAKWERVAAVSNQLKQGTLDLGIPVIATVQLKRGANGKDDYDTEDISYSDALGQDADFIITVRPGKVMPERVELGIIKNRFGQQVACNIHIDFDSMTITDESVSGAISTPKSKLKPITISSWSDEED